MKVIGLMSGTSADGIDAALTEIRGEGLKTKIKLIAFETYSFPRKVRKMILNASDPKTARIDQICHLNFYLGELFAEAARAVAKKAGLGIREVDLIGSHGQTIHHLPREKREGGYKIRSTLQIGEPSIIAERTGVATVADFRPRDIAAGGEGAPLSPYLHYLLFSNNKKGLAVQNLGGISNITFIPARAGIKDILAFDNGPGNMLIDGVVERLTQGRSRYDKYGRRAAKGKVNSGLLKQLLKHPFIHQPPPKSTGREQFGARLIDDIIKSAGRKKIPITDLMATITAFTAHCIGISLEKFILPRYQLVEMIVGGGGVGNPVLMSMLKERLKPLRISTFEDYRLDSDAIEAIAFALLAYETIQSRPGNIPAATGATGSVILGKIVPGTNPNC
ncbi:MAG: anhydro-N-acetylmuramic acid kinase [Deltaproteobacteria bacterium]|nr:MAG: anhydro-N-acetylmuramic acid kinase [Deltaproteobacteria bacterium]